MSDPRSLSPEPPKVSRLEALNQLRRERVAKDDWPFGDKLTCLLRIVPDSPASGFTTAQNYELRNGVVIEKSKGWMSVTRKAWRQLKDVRTGTDVNSPRMFEWKDDPGALSLDALVEKFPIEPESEEDASEEVTASDEVQDEDPTTATEEDDKPRRGGLRRKTAK